MIVWVILRCCCFSTESRDNPFQADGELAQKAEYILSHSTISRTQLRISDPDLSREEEMEQMMISKTENAPLNAMPQTNGQLEKPVNAASVEVEVGKGNADNGEPQQAEQIKVKQKKCQCCVVM